MDTLLTVGENKIINRKSCTPNCTSSHLEKSTSLHIIGLCVFVHAHKWVDHRTIMLYFSVNELSSYTTWTLDIAALASEAAMDKVYVVKGQCVSILSTDCNCWLRMSVIEIGENKYE